MCSTFLDANSVLVRQLAVGISCVANLLYFFAECIPEGGVKEIMEKSLDVVVRKKFVKSFIKGVPMRRVSKIDHFPVDAINNNIVIISHVVPAYLDNPVIPTTKVVVHPVLPFILHENGAV